LATRQINTLISQNRCRSISPPTIIFDLELPPPSNTKQMPPALETNTSNDQIVDEEENEPPPILCRGKILYNKKYHIIFTDEPSGTHSIESIFQKEAKIIREKMFDSNGKKLGPIVHEIDGFRIEVGFFIFYYLIPFYLIFI